jgi:hypothetical protein
VTVGRRISLAGAVARASYDGAALSAAVVALAVRIPSLDLPLIEWHGWRQTWTAYTALVFHEQGFDLLHPQLPIVGPPYEVPMEFPAVQAVAALVMNAGVAPDLSMRITHLALFFLSAGLLYGLMKRVAGPLVALAALTFFLFVPTNLLWSRAALTEYGATAGALGFLWAGIVWRETRRPATFAIALVAGTLGMLIKPTTPVFWTLPLLFWRVPGDTDGLVAWVRGRVDPALVALCIVPTAVAFAWTAWADGIKGAHDAAAYLTSTATRTFYYASLGERLDPVIWARTWSWISGYLIGLGMLPVFALGLWAAWRSTRPAFWAGLLLAATLPFAIFYGGYYRHDYYWSALTPEVAAFIGLAVAWLVARARAVPQRAAIAVALVLAALLSLQSSHDYWARMYPPLDDYERILPRARELAALTRPDDPVVMVGRGLDPDVLYYARRRGLQLVFPEPTLAGNATMAVFRALPSGPYRVFFSFDPAHDPIYVQRLWRWSGVIGAYTYVVGASPSDLRRAPAVASDDRDAFDSAARGARPLTGGPVTIACDLRGAQIARGASGTWLRFSSDGPGTARVWVDTLLGPLPLRSVIALGPEVSPGSATISISCIGAAAVTIEAAVDATPPGR